MRYEVKIFKPGDMKPAFVGWLSSTRPMCATPESEEKLQQAEAEWVCKLEQVLNNSTIGRCHINEMGE